MKSAASKQSQPYILMAGAALTLLVAAVQAVPLAESVSHPQSAKVAKGKAVHYIENIPGHAKVQEEAKETDIPLLPPIEVPSASESPPLELKGVCG